MALIGKFCVVHTYLPYTAASSLIWCAIITLCQYFCALLLTRLTIFEMSITRQLLNAWTFIFWAIKYSESRVITISRVFLMNLLITVLFFLVIEKNHDNNFVTTNQICIPRCLKAVKFNYYFYVWWAGYQLKCTSIFYDPY